MNTKSRIFNSIRNSIAGIASQGCNIIVNFTTRLFFVKFLSAEYLGINGLFSNILTVLSLAELGVGTAIIYSLYKPVANKDEKLIAALLNYYKQAYIIIGTIITIVGMCLIPFLKYIIKDVPNISNLNIIYILFLANTAGSYFFAYRRAIFTADQREHLLSEYRMFFVILRAIGQCLILVLTKDFVLYLLIQIFCTFAENIWISYKADVYYPFLSENKKEKLPVEITRKIKTDIKSLMIYKVGSTALDGTDNIILSSFVGVIWVGKLSNYTLIISAISMMTSQIISALTASVGNYIATEKKERYEELLMKMLYLSFIIYGISLICLNCMLTPFVQLVFGEKYILDFAAVFISCLNFFIFGMMNSIWTFRTTMGLFKYGKYRPIISAIINIVISIVLAKKMGLIGVLLGTTITRVVTNLWYDPYIVYKYGLKKSPFNYYLCWIKYFIISLLTMFICEIIFQNFTDVNIVIILLKLIICCLVFGINVVLWTFMQPEYKYMKNLIISMAEKFRTNFKC